MQLEWKNILYRSNFKVYRYPLEILLQESCLSKKKLTLVDSNPIKFQITDLMVVIFPVHTYRLESKFIVLNTFTLFFKEQAKRSINQ